MPKKPIKILAINPGTKYLGIAVFHDGDLRDWSIKVMAGKWSQGKLIKAQAIITELLFQYRPDAIVLKSLNPFRRSGNLERLVGEIQSISGKKGITIHEYSIEDLKSTAMISRWEKGESFPDWENLLKLAAIYRTMIDALYIDHMRLIRADVLSKEALVQANKN